MARYRIGISMYVARVTSDKVRKKYKLSEAEYLYLMLYYELYAYSCKYLSEIDMYRNMLGWKSKLTINRVKRSLVDKGWLQVGVGRKRMYYVTYKYEDMIKYMNRVHRELMEEMRYNEEHIDERYRFSKWSQHKLDMRESVQEDLYGYVGIKYPDLLIMGKLKRGERLNELTGEFEKMSEAEVIEYERGLADKMLSREIDNELLCNDGLDVYGIRGLVSVSHRRKVLKSKRNNSRNNK